MSDKSGWERYGKWIKMSYAMHRYSREEVMHAVKVWAIDQDIWSGATEISITGISPYKGERHFQVDFRIEGLNGEFRVTSDELTELCS
jgi:hypothetical protein